MKSKKYYSQLIGKKFRRLTITGFSEPTKRKNGRCYTNVTYICDCGNTGEAPLTCVITRYHSCGCYEIDNPSRKRHGMSKDRLFNIWSSMKHRCDDQENPAYHNYGGRGISYCEEWKLSDNFFKWALANGYKKTLTLERIRVDEGYCPENCTWIPMSQQSRNTRKTIRLEINGVSKPLIEWCEIKNVSYDKAYRLAKNNLANHLFI